MSQVDRGSPYDSFRLTTTEAACSISIKLAHILSWAHLADGLPCIEDVRDTMPFIHARESLLTVTINCFFELSFLDAIEDVYLRVSF